MIRAYLCFFRKYFDALWKNESPSPGHLQKDAVLTNRFVTDWTSEHRRSHLFEKLQFYFIIRFCRCPFASLTEMSLLRFSTAPVSVEQVLTNSSLCWLSQFLRAFTVTGIDCTTSLLTSPLLHSFDPYPYSSFRMIHQLWIRTTSSVPHHTFGWQRIQVAEFLLFLWNPCISRRSKGYHHERFNQNVLTEPASNGQE